HKTSEIDLTAVRSFLSEPFPLYNVESKTEVPEAVDCVLDASAYQGEISNILEKIEGNPYTSQEQFLRSAELLFHELPRDVRVAVSDFRRKGNLDGVMLVRGLPIDIDLPPTPVDIHENRKSTSTSEALLAAFGMALGDPMTYSQQHDGKLFHTIVPIKKDADEQSFSGSSVLLEFHTEITFHPFTPHFLQLYCLRQDHHKVAKTLFAPVRRIINNMPLNMRSILFEERFETRIDYSWNPTQKENSPGRKCALLYGSVYDPFLNYDIDLMKGLDDQAQAALETMAESANEKWNYVRLQPGDLLIIDNRRSIHGRSSYEPLYDGKDRWLQRLYVVRDLAMCSEERYRSERVIDTKFGSVSAGV
ncbi:MAG: TauD/TfdA family dioxygenase, partial [Pseudomonadota bacterium]